MPNELIHWKRPWCWEGLGAGGEGDNRRWDGWMASPTRWAWVWVNSGSWWWTGRPGVLRFMGSQRPTRLSNWTELNWAGLGKELYLPSCLIYSGEGAGPGSGLWDLLQSSLPVLTSPARLPLHSRTHPTPCLGKLQKPQLSGCLLAANFLWDSCKHKIYFSAVNLVYVNLIITKPKTLEGKKGKVPFSQQNSLFWCQSKAWAVSSLLPEACRLRLAPMSGVHPAFLIATPRAQSGWEVTWSVYQNSQQNGDLFGIVCLPSTWNLFGLELKNFSSTFLRLTLLQARMTFCTITSPGILDIGKSLCSNWGYHSVCAAIDLKV